PLIPLALERVIAAAAFGLDGRGSQTIHLFLRVVVSGHALAGEQPALLVIVLAPLKGGDEPGTEANDFRIIRQTQVSRPRKAIGLSRLLTKRHGVAGVANPGNNLDRRVVGPVVLQIRSILDRQRREPRIRQPGYQTKQPTHLGLARRPLTGQGPIGSWPALEHEVLLAVLNLDPG